VRGTAGNVEDSRGSGGIAGKVEEL